MVSATRILSLCFTSEPDPFADPKVIELWVKVQKAVYDELRVKTADDRENLLPGPHPEGNQNFGLDGYHQESVANLDR